MIRRRKSGEFLRQTSVHPFGRLTLAGLHIDYRATEPMPMRFWDTFAVVYVLAGRARFRDESGLSLPLRPGDLLLMFPGHGYRYEIDPRRPWSEFYLHFQGPVFELMRAKKVIDPTQPIYRLTPVEKWLQRFERLVRSRPVRRAGDVMKQVCHFLDLLADALAKAGIRKDAHPQNLWLVQATAVLNEQPIAKPLDWNAVSAQMGLSYDRFRKKFLQLAGTSPAKYFMSRRLEAACTMLQDRTLGLKEIARECGFCDVFHFSKRFKQGLRLTPTEYREYKLHEP